MTLIKNTHGAVYKNESTLVKEKRKLCINPKILDNGREIALH